MSEECVEMVKRSRQLGLYIVGDAINLNIFSASHPLVFNEHSLLSRCIVALDCLTQRLS